MAEEKNTATERKLFAGRIDQLQILIRQAMEPLMIKRRSRTLDRLMSANAELDVLRMTLRDDDSVVLVALYVRNMNIKDGELVAKKGESVWVKLHKALPQHRDLIHTLHKNLDNFVQNSLYCILQTQRRT